MRTLVTGGTGLLGAAVVTALRSTGRDPVVLVRDAERGRALLGDVELVVGDVTEKAVWDRALPGVDAVVNCAAYLRDLLRPGASVEPLYRTNVIAVADLLAAATRHGVATVVQIGSNTALGSVDGRRAVLDETAPWRSAAITPYSASKIAAEAVVAAHVARGDGPRVPMILPAWLIGPYDAAPSSAGQLIRDIAKSALPGLPNVVLHPTDTRDVALACVAALDAGESGRRYLVAGPALSMPAVGAAIAAQVGSRAPVRLPPRVALAAAVAAERVAKITGRRAAAGADAVRILLSDARYGYVSSRTSAELGVSPRTFAETVTDSVAWLRDAGMLGR